MAMSLALRLQPRTCPLYPHIKRIYSRREKSVHTSSFFKDLFGKDDQTRDESSESFDSPAGSGGGFVPLDPESDRGLDESSENPFGPLAILAVGLMQDEFLSLQNLLRDIEADMVSLIPASLETLQNKALSEAFLPAENGERSIPHKYEIPENGTPKVLFLSGMYSSEVVEIVTAVKTLGIEDCIFAAAVPRSWDRRVCELIEDVAADHRAMSERRLQEGQVLRDEEEV